MNFIKNKKLLFTTLLIVILVSMTALSLVACQPKGEPAVSAQTNDNVIPEDFSIEDSVVLLTHSDGTVETINVTRDMLSDEDFAKLSSPGIHTITINYAKDKSLQVQINLLRAIDKETARNRLVQGIQKTAAKNNINGEIELSAYYQIANQARKEYKLSLQFTLDIDQFGGAENYLGIELAEDDNALLTLYYKDNTEERPYIYLKTGGIVANVLRNADNKFKTVSVDDYFGEAMTPDEDQLLTFDGILDQILELVNNNLLEGVVNTVLEMASAGAGVAVDDKTLVLKSGLNNIFGNPWVALGFGALAGGQVESFFASMGANVKMVDVINELKTSPMSINALFDDEGGLTSLDVTDGKKNSAINLLQLKIDGKIDAEFNIDKISIKADDTSFSLPTDKGLEDWEENEHSLERWILYQWHGARAPRRAPNVSNDIAATLEVPYKGDDSEFHKLDIYRPKDRVGEKLPVLIHIHGGGWVHGRKEGVSQYCQEISRRGFAVLAINYHLLPYGEKMPEPMQDVFAALNFVKDNAELYGFDADNVFLSGDSAGGHYAMLTLSILVDPELRELYGVTTDVHVSGAAVSSTGFSFTDILEQFRLIPFAHFYVNQFFSEDVPYTAYRDDPRYQAMAKSLSLENNKIERFPPMFVSSAYGDGFSEHSFMLVEELQKRGVEYEFDFREVGDADNPENHFLGHNFNMPNQTPISKVVNNKIADFFLEIVSKKLEE